MKRICYVLYFLMIVLSFTACGKVDETAAKALVDELVEYIEQGEYDSAADLFCYKYERDSRKTLPKYLDEIERKTGLDFQSGIEITECVVDTNQPSSYYGLNCIDFDIKAVIGGKDVLLYIEIFDNYERLEVCCFVVYDDISDQSNYYQFLPDIDLSE
ncbi:MAG: hypothetical protein J6Q89_03970 [Clostridia bacterium]|nr:hypothetical protein [Clostridia bacterium]